MGKWVRSMLAAISIGTSLYSSSGTGAVSAKPVIGYGASDAVLAAHSQELFYMGFELGLKSRLKQSLGTHQFLTERSQDKKPLAAMRIAKKMAQSGVSILTGFPTSHEALLAGKVASETGTLAIFPAASHLQLAEFGPLVHTTGEPMTYVASSMLKEMDRLFPKKKVVLISNPESVFSINLEKAILEQQKKREFSCDLEYLRTLSSGKLDSSALQKVQESQAVAFTAYPDESAGVLGQLEAIHLDLPLLANPSWTTGDVELLRRILTRRKSPMYSLKGWLETTPSAQAFTQKVKSVYGKLPTTEMAFGYDVGVIIATILNRLGGEPPTKQNVVEALKKNYCFEGCSSETICLSEKGGHAIRTLFPVVFTKDKGFVPSGPPIQ